MNNNKRSCYINNRSTKRFRRFFVCTLIIIIGNNPLLYLCQQYLFSTHPRLIQLKRKYSLLLKSGPTTPIRWFFSQGKDLLLGNSPCLLYIDLLTGSFQSRHPQTSKTSRHSLFFFTVQYELSSCSLCTVSHSFTFHKDPSFLGDYYNPSTHLGPSDLSHSSGSCNYLTSSPLVRRVVSHSDHYLQHSPFQSSTLH